MVRQRDDMVTLLPAGDPDAEPDIENAFDELREAVEKSVPGGMIRVLRVPLDEKQAPMANAKGQSELFSIPVDQFNLDEIIARVRRGFIRKGEVRIAIRILATKTGERGTRLNRILVVEKENEDESTPNRGGESLSEMMRLTQEMIDKANERHESMMARILEARTAQPTKDPMDMAIALMGAMSGFLGKIPTPAAAAAQMTLPDPMSQMTATLGAIKLLSNVSKELAGGKVSDAVDDEDDNSIPGIIRSVAGAVRPLAEGYAENKRMQREAAQRIAPRRLAPPSAPPASTARPTAPAAAILDQSSSAPRPVATPPGASAPPISTPAMAAQQEEKDMLNQIGPQLENACNLAQQGADPKDAAGLLMDMLPEKFDDALWKLVSSDRFVKNLALLNKRVNDHAEWFEQFRQAIIAEFSSDETVGEPGDEI